MAKMHKSICYSCGETSPEYVLDDRPLCWTCYRRERNLALGD
ncbi:MAG: hypothetical protein WC203_04160 [Candidatus Bathyarchaeia archaeon]|nr:hypothetical protein [Thermoproteota archaeon]